MARKEVCEEVENLLYRFSVPRLEIFLSPYQPEFSFMADESRSREEKASLLASEHTSNRNWYNLYQK